MISSNFKTNSLIAATAIFLALGTAAIAPKVVQAADVTGGKTLANSYVKNIPGNGGYRLTPLLTVGDEMNLLEGDFSAGFTANANKKFAFAGIPDGMGVFETKDYNYVFINHEISASTTSYLNATSNEIIKGARVSLLQFDKNWNVIGGKNLIDTAVLNGTQYQLNTTTGLYTEPISGTALSFSRFCSAYLAQSGFVDEQGNPAPIYFAPEEGGGGDRGWAVNANGTAQALQLLGRYSKENVVAARDYRANNPSGKTVLISTEDTNDGEIYMFVGEQTASDPNGFTNGNLYVLRVTDESGNTVSGETLSEQEKTKATWMLVEKGIDLESASDLSNYVNGQDTSGQLRSTNFRRLEDIAEDPNNPGTFYFVTTGTTDKLTGGTAANAGEAENPYGKLYRFSLNPNDPAGEISDFELLLNGGLGKGVSYDNIVVDANGNVLIMEDETAFGGEVMAVEGRDARIWSYNLASGTLTPLFEVDETAAGTPDPGVGVWETSGIVEVSPNALRGRSSYLFDVQAHSIKDARYVEGGQLILATPVSVPEPGTTTSLVLLGLSALGLKLKFKFMGNLSVIHR
jgi:glycerophosphoryl diester phosphodiesterase